MWHVWLVSINTDFVPLMRCLSCAIYLRSAFAVATIGFDDNGPKNVIMVGLEWVIHLDRDLEKVRVGRC